MLLRYLILSLFLFYFPAWADDADHFFDAAETTTTPASLENETTDNEAQAEPVTDDFSATTPSQEEQDLPANETAPIAKLERYNQSTYKFNNSLDHYFLKPIAQGYHWITPAPIDNGITHIFSNIAEIPTTINALLQAKPTAAGKSTLRLLINTTFGLLGFFDVATKWGVDEQQEDFAQTLAVWGVPTGAYIELPFFGPSTVRNAPSRIVDALFNPLRQIDDTRTYIAVNALDIVDTRADLLDKEKLITGDRYQFIKEAYLQRRHYLELGGKVEDNFDQSIEESDDWMDE